MILRQGTYLQNRYEVIDQIGSGGMSEVYKAKDHTLNRFVAIKLLKEEFCSDENFVKKFKMEAQSAAGLSHPNIVSIYDVVDEGKMHYIVMELIEGITLKQYIAKKSHLEIREATSIAIQVAQGILAAHERKIIHRDIKPQNIILSGDGKIKVADFGIAHAVSSQTANSTAMGSVHYISPEQAKNLTTDERSDIYSLGITMYEMVTGRLPFQGDNTVSVAIAQLEEAMTPPSVYNPEVPVSLEKIILKCTEKNPDNRYQSTHDVIADLQRSLVDPDGIPAGAAGYGSDSIDGDTVILNNHEMNAIRSVAGKKKPSDKIREQNGRKNRKADKVITGAGITIAILIAAAVLFLLLKFSGMVGNTKASASDSMKENTSGFESLSVKETYMPYVIGLDETAAENKLKESNLQMNVTGSDYSDQFEKNFVMEQDPEAGTVISKYSKVNVKISLGSNKMDLSALGISSMTGTDAETALKAQGLSVIVSEEYNDSIETGKVISFDPAKAEKGATVTLKVSKGKEIEKTTVPVITGITEEAAIGLLADAGLKPGSVKVVSSDTVPAGTVISQDIAAGKEADKDSKVGYTVSSGTAASTSASETVEPVTGENGYKYIASIDTTYNLSSLIGPGSWTSSFQVMIRLKQSINGQDEYKTLMEPRTVSGDTILPVRFKSIEGIYGVDSGVVQVVRADDNTVLQGYDVQFFKVQ